MNIEIQQPLMPREVTHYVGFFDRFAGKVSEIASRAYFFTFCVLLILFWLPSYFIVGSIDTWQLIINTVTTIITFLLVALLQNSQTRSDHAVQHKLNAIADGLAELMESISTEPSKNNLHSEVKELRTAVGIEIYESTDRPSKQ